MVFPLVFELRDGCKSDITTLGYDIQGCNYVSSKICSIVDGFFNLILFSTILIE